MIVLSLSLLLGCFEKKPIQQQPVTKETPYTVVPHPDEEEIIRQDPIKAPDLTFTLNRIMDVEGRQGIAIDEKHYFVSGTSSLYAYSKEGELLISNTKPLQAYPQKVNHIGDIDQHDGKLYTSVEWFEKGKGTNMQIGIHDSTSLKFIQSFPLAETTQSEFSGIAIDTVQQRLWLCSWVNDESGSYLYEYDLTNGSHIGSLQLDTPPKYVQGIAYHNGALYLTADDGDAIKNEPDHLYRVDLNGPSRGKVTQVKTFDDIKAHGEIEGLSFDKQNNELIVHFNRGKRIKNGKPLGLLPGYDSEIHELYIYKVMNK